MFLSFVGNKIHIGINYKNHSGFISCFVFKTIKIEKPVFIIKDFSLALGCQYAYIRPDFSELANKKAIILNCSLKNASFFVLEKKMKGADGALGEFLGGIYGENINRAPFLDRLINVLFGTVNTKLRIYGETLEFLSFDATSPDIRLCASGFITESEDLGLDMKIFFSPEMAQSFPEELKGLLTPVAKGWLSYRIELERSVKESFFKLDSDRIKMKFEKVETR